MEGHQQSWKRHWHACSHNYSSFDKEVGVPVPSGKHSDKADLEAIVNQLMESSVFDPSTTSKHRSFSTIKANLIRTLEEKAVKDWMTERFSVLDLQYSPPSDIQSYAEESDDTF